MQIMCMSMRRIVLRDSNSLKRSIDTAIQFSRQKKNAAVFCIKNCTNCKIVPRKLDVH